MMESNCVNFNPNLAVQQMAQIGLSTYNIEVKVIPIFKRVSEAIA